MYLVSKAVSPVDCLQNTLQQLPLGLERHQHLLEIGHSKVHTILEVHLKMCEFILEEQKM